MKLIKNLGLRKSKNENRQRRYGLFLCKYCFNIIEKRMDLGSNSESCGCNKNKLISNKNKIHGDSRNNKYTKLYNIWKGMKQRCNNPCDTGYKDYGGRGIKICKEWNNNYIIFKIWAIAHSYKENLTIDRINNNGNYEPNNCRWITNAENCRNTRRTKLNWSIVGLLRIMHKDGYTPRKLFNIFNIKYKTICSVLYKETWIESEIII